MFKWPFERDGKSERIAVNGRVIINDADLAVRAAFDGLFLYYPGHRQVPVALRALIDMLRSARGSVPAEGLLENPFSAE